jgi:hypothetical protein
VSRLPARTGKLVAVKPYTDNIVTNTMMLTGFEAAYERFHAAAKGDDEGAAFVGLFECLNWVVALDDRVGQHWAPRGKPLGFAWRDEVPGAELMKGVRWARNSVHHKWSDALRLTDGFQFPITFGLVFHEWSWAPASDLPPLDRPDPDGESVYRDKLENRAARVALGELLQAFRFVGQLLEPPRPMSAPSETGDAIP